MFYSNKIVIQGQTNRIQTILSNTQLYKLISKLNEDNMIIDDVMLLITVIEYNFLNQCNALWNGKSKSNKRNYAKLILPFKNGKIRV